MLPWSSASLVTNCSGVALPLIDIADNCRPAVQPSVRRIKTSSCVADSVTPCTLSSARASLRVMARSAARNSAI